MVRFEGLVAIDGINLSLSKGEILGLIGPNGAGKTTLVNVFTGFQRPDSGRVSLGGEDVTSLGPHRLARKGIARSFQNVRLFKEFSTRENLVASAIGVGLNKRQAQERADDVLAWCGLSELADVPTDILPYGDERRVGIARALAMAPNFILMDEPAAGLSDLECDDLMKIISRIPMEFECGVLLIEHNMRVVMGVCSRIHVIDFGKTIAEGSPLEIQRNPEVIAAYLGMTK